MHETNSSSCAYQYTVKRGDSFYLIAHRLGVQLRDLLEANPDIPPSRLTIGDVLCIPPGSDVEKPACEQQNAGNTNGNTPGNTAGNAAGDSQENDGTSQPEAPAVTVPACPPNRRAVVQNGQTASDLQLRYGLSYHTLQSANPQRDLEHLQGGDVLCIPESNTACPLPASIMLGDQDSLESIANTYNVPIAALLRVNPCLAPEDFKPGTAIRLPD